VKVKVPALRELSEFVATLDRHPFGALTLVFMIALVVLGLWVLRH
jgi:hypothetical protein